MTKQKTTVIYINADAPVSVVKGFFLSKEGAAFWRDVVAAAAEREPELNEIAEGLAYYLNAVYLPADVAAPLIKRLDDLRPQNIVFVPGEGWQFPNDSNKPIQHYTTDQAPAGWIRRFLGLPDPVRADAATAEMTEEQL